MNTLLFIFNGDFGSRSQAISIIKQIPTIVGWRCDMPNAIYLKSESSPQELCDEIRAFNGQGKFLVIEITNNRQGYLTKETWDFLRNNSMEKDGTK